MGRMQPLLIMLLVVVSVGIAPGVVIADDDWPDNCGDAPIVDTTGEYSVSIDTPSDMDYIRVRLTKGDYIHFSLIVPDSQKYLHVRLRGVGNSPGVSSLTAANNVDLAGGGVAKNFVSGVEASWKGWAEQDGSNVYCISVNDGSEAEIPYQFTLKMRLNSPDPESFKSGSSQSELEQMNQRISQLESLIEQKNQRISELESQVSQLERSSSGGSSHVTIQVTVMPANGRQEFVEGGEALIQAKSENTDVSEMYADYGSGTYQLDSSGEVAIPLVQAGTQDITLAYKNTTKRVSIEVKPQERNNQQDTVSTGTSVPGFGVVAALVAVLGCALLFNRYQQL